MAFKVRHSDLAKLFAFASVLVLMALLAGISWSGQLIQPLPSEQVAELATRRTRDDARTTQEAQRDSSTASSTAPIEVKAVVDGTRFHVAQLPPYYFREWRVYAPDRTSIAPLLVPKAARWVPNAVASGSDRDGRVITSTGDLAALTTRRQRQHQLLYLMDDGCALGHYTKDIGVILSLLEFAKAQRRKESTRSFIVSVLFNQQCSTRGDFYSTDGSTSLVKGVLRHWYLALEANADKIVTTNSEIAESDKGQGVTLQFHFLKDEGLSTKLQFPKVPTTVVLRPRSWRWFSSPWDSQWFHNVLVDEYCQRMTTTRSGTGGELSSQPARVLPIKIIIIQRKKNRQFREQHWAKQIEKFFGGDTVSVTVVSLEGGGGMSYCDQLLKVFYAADILITAHGAALTSIIGMRPNFQTAVIELFPHHFRYVLYQELALVHQVHYYSLEGMTPIGGCRSKCPRRPWASPNVGGAGVNEREVTSAQDDEKEKEERETPEENNTVDKKKPHSEYEALRHLNGWSKCKNCDIDVSEAQLMSTIGTAISSILLGRTRGGHTKDITVGAEHHAKDGKIGSLRYIDRRG